MANETLARRYATAVFQLAQEASNTSGVQHDLHTFVESLAVNSPRFLVPRCYPSTKSFALWVSGVQPNARPPQSAVNLAQSLKLTRAA